MGRSRCHLCIFLRNMELWKVAQVSLPLRVTGITLGKAGELPGLWGHEVCGWVLSLPLTACVTLSKL